MTLDFIRGIQTLIIAFLSYVITITFAGWFESLVAKKMGDDTPEQLGFLTLNPLDHFNVFGFAAVLWGLFYARLLPFQFIPGWGRYIPLLPDTMRGKNLRLRGFVEFMGRSLAHLILLLITTAVIFMMCKNAGCDVLNFIIHLNQGSSFTQVITTLLLSLYDQNLILFIVHVVIGIFKYVLHFHVPRLQDVSMSRIILGCLVLTLGVFILRPILQDFVFLLIKLLQLIII